LTVRVEDMPENNARIAKYIPLLRENGWVTTSFKDLINRTPKYTIRQFTRACFTNYHFPARPFIGGPLPEAEYQPPELV
jgi:hypothetical protein